MRDKKERSSINEQLEDFKMMRRCGLPSNSHLTRFRFILRITRSHFRNRPYPANKLHRQGFSFSKGYVIALINSASNI